MFAEYAVEITKETLIVTDHRHFSAKSSITGLYLQWAAVQ